MTISLSDFRSKFDSEPASLNRFIMQFTSIPAPLEQKFPEVVRSLQFRIQSGEVPGRAINTADSFTYGPTRKFPTNAIYASMNIGVIVTSLEWIERKFFDEWTNLIVGNDEFQLGGRSNNVEFYDNIVGTARVTTYDTGYNETSSYELIECYPMSVQPVPLNWDTQNAYALLNVEMAYRMWRRTL